MEAIAAEQPGTNRSAWALYQARQAARLSRDAEGAASLERRLRNENPSHPLVARLGPGAPPPAPVRAALADCGPRSLAHFASGAGKPVDLAKVRRLCGTDDSGTTMQGLARAARRMGFDATPLQVDRWYLQRNAVTGIAWVDGNHYLAFRPAAQGRFTVFDPNDAAVVELTASELHRRSQGILLVLEPTAGPAGADRR